MNQCNCQLFMLTSYFTTNVQILNNDGVLPPMHHVGLDDVNIHKVRHLDLLPGNIVMTVTSAEAVCT